MTELETIRICRSLPEASVVQSWLEARGVECVLGDAGPGPESEPREAEPVGAALRVPVTETARARRLLAEYDAEGEEEAEERPTRRWPSFIARYYEKRASSREWSLLSGIGNAVWLSAFLVGLVWELDVVIVISAIVGLVELVDLILFMTFGSWWLRRRDS